MRTGNPPLPGRSKQKRNQWLALFIAPYEPEGLVIIEEAKKSLRSLWHGVDRILGTQHVLTEHGPSSRDDLALLHVHGPHRFADGSHCNLAGQQSGHDESRESVPEASQRTRLPA